MKLVLERAAALQRLPGMPHRANSGLSNNSKG